MRGMGLMAGFVIVAMVAFGACSGGDAQGEQGIEYIYIYIVGVL